MAKPSGTNSFSTLLMVEFKGLCKVFLYLNVLQLDELEHLDDGRVEEVVPVIVRDESVHHRSKRFSLNKKSHVNRMITRVLMLSLAFFVLF